MLVRRENFWFINLFCAEKFSFFCQQVSDFQSHSSGFNVTKIERSYISVGNLSQVQFPPSIAFIDTMRTSSQNLAAVVVLLLNGLPLPSLKIIVFEKSLSSVKLFEPS